MNQQQQQQLTLQQQRLEQQLSQCASTTDISRLENKVDALQDGLSSVLKLLAHRGHPECSSHAAVEVPCKRARSELTAAAASPLDDNEIFGSVLSYVGYGDYFYVAGFAEGGGGAISASLTQKHRLTSSVNCAYSVKLWYERLHGWRLTTAHS
jgi:hypothetical protein